MSRTLLRDRKAATPRLATAFAKAVFPHHLTTKELVEIIADSHPAQEHTVSGFPTILVELYDLCANAVERAEFVDGIAKTCLTGPFEDNFNRVSAHHSELAKHLESLAKRELQSLGQTKPPNYLVRLLMAVERANREYRSQDEWPDLCKLVRANAPLQRQLF